jgi:hypothetical protein
MENGQEFEMPSKAKLYVSIAEWDKVKALHDALAKELNGQGVSPAEVAAVLRTAKSYASKLPGAAPAGPDDGDGGAEKLTLLALLASKGLAVASSKEIETAIFACAEKAVYKHDGTVESSVPFKLNVPGYNVFDNPKCRDKARLDFYEICNAVAEVNLRPFGEALFSMFMARMGKSANIPASNSAKE